MFTTKKAKPTKPQPQQVAIQDGQVIGVLIRRTSTWKRLKTQTTKAVKVVTPKRTAPPSGREHLRRPNTGENQSFYRSSYLALNPQRQWDLYIAGLAPQGVPAPRGPPPPQKGITPRQFKTVNVMYLTKPSPTGVQAGTITYLPDAFEVAKGKKKAANPDALPVFPTPGQGVKIVQRPVKGQQQQQQQQQQQVRVSNQARPVQVVRVQQQPQRVLQQQQQQYVQVTVPVAQVQRPQTQQFVAVPVGQVQQGVVRPVSQVVQRPVQQQQQQQQQRQQRPQTQFVTVPIQQVQQVQRPQQPQQQQQFLVLQAVAQPQTQQQVVMIPAINTQPARQQVRTGGRRVAGQSVMTVRA
ncbi:hypothetical protein QBC41DRAFT_142686 [Cercophora samala]|uniref:Uncharacterized protein n=1 Tax=Cercophora samala TaxID=330535 RepID=A0AA39ZA02_9PEZI|nr:hypothetical protein QBC41DRAFT_142686 [Cercophora samala]